MKGPNPNSFILIPKISLKVRRQNCPDSSTFPFTHNTWIYLILTTNIFFPNSSLRTLIYNPTWRHQFIIEFETTHKSMFRTPYPVRIKVSIFNQSKIFNSPFFSSDSRPSLFSFCSNFLVNPLPTSVYSTYKPLILDGFLKF